MAARRRPRQYRENDEYVRFMRRVVTRAADRVDDAEDLRELVALQDELRQSIERAVAKLRANGYTWTAIGEALGISKQAARQRWGHLDPSTTAD